MGLGEAVASGGREQVMRVARGTVFLEGGVSEGYDVRGRRGKETTNEQ